VTADEFRKRTKAFALRGIRLADALPRSLAGTVVARQLIRCMTSVGANYRAVCRAKSRRDFISKMLIVEEECDESLYWMELLADGGLVKPARLKELMTEGGELLSMVVASIRTARAATQRTPANRNPQSAIRNPQLLEGS
jgi:four helix bundle protein